MKIQKKNSFLAGVGRGVRSGGGVGGGGGLARFGLGGGYGGC